MKASDIPAKFPIPWAENAGGAYKRAIPENTVSPIEASLELGWPPDTATPTSAGGTPPDVRDANGLENQVTAWVRYLSAGGPITYDSAFSAKIGGYPAGAILKSTTAYGKYWISTADDNTTDPDGGSPANWQLFPDFTNVVYYINTAVTKTVYGSGADFADLGVAFEWVNKFIITPAGSVTFNLAAGQHAHVSRVDMSHADGDRISVVGANLLGPVPTPGSFAINGSSSGQRATDAVTNIAAMRAVFATELQFNASNGVTMPLGAKTALLKNVLISGAGSGIGLHAKAGSTLGFETVCVYNFSTNVFATGKAVVNGINLYSIKAAEDGISADAGSVIKNESGGYLVSCQAASECLQSTDASTIMSVDNASCRVGGAGIHGAHVWKSASMWLPGINVTYCGGNGVRSADSASAKIDGGQGSNCSLGLLYAIYDSSLTAGTFTTANQTPADFTATSGSYIYAAGYTSPGATFSPAKNTVGNGNSYIEA